MDDVALTAVVNSSSPPELEILNPSANARPPAMRNLSLMSSSSSNRDMLELDIMAESFTDHVDQTDKADHQQQHKTISQVTTTKRKRARQPKGEKQFQPTDTFLPDTMYTGMEVVDEFHHFLRQNKLPVNCHRHSALLFKDRFGSGNKGKCILFHGQWITPVQFEKASGLQLCRDWRRSIKYGGQPILALINGGHLKQHATSCTCGVCYEGATIPGPVRLFVPHKRRRKNAGAVSLKYQMPPPPDNVSTYKTAIETSSSTNIVTMDTSEFLQDLSPGIKSLIDALFVEHNAEEQKLWSKLEEKAKRLQTEADELRESIYAMKEKSMKQKLNMMKQLSIQMEHYAGAIGNSASKSNDEYDVSCNHCGNVATSECTGCHKATYCSIDCQQKDWQAGHSRTCQMQSSLTLPTETNLTDINTVTVDEISNITE